MPSSPPRGPMPMDLSAAAIETMASLTERLARAIEDECETIAARQFSRLKGQIERKLQVVGAYERQIALMGGGAVVAADPMARARLRDPTQRLREAMSLHTVRVAAARTVTDRLVRSVAEAVAEKARPVLGYGPGAALRTAHAAPAAMAIRAEA
ncbi:hypothetical protein [Zavarzinia sp.]|uniref:hypothetical protein n=1 Tax=Zavarzinia sp. TaxID=2027920 RepID=UPI003BB7E819|nr:hypothetical protein [Zavarzinia sp.]